MALKEKQVTVYELVCDQCLTTFEDGGVDYIPMYTDTNEPVETAVDCYDWVEIDGKHFCPECPQPETPNE